MSIPSLHDLMPYLRPAMGYDACDLSLSAVVPSLTLLGLLCSFGIRYRAIMYRARHKNKNPKGTPTRGCYITAVPWEAVLALIFLVFPRFVWAADLASRALEKGAWEHRNLQGVFGWIVFAYLVGIDIFEKRNSQMLMRLYYAIKAKTTTTVNAEKIDPADAQSQLTKEQLEDSRAHVDDLEAQPTTQTITSLGRFQQWIRKRTANFELSAVNMLTHLHLCAFIKAMLIFILLSQIAISACWFEDRTASLFDTSDNLFLPLTVVSGLLTVRTVGIIVRSVNFGRVEVDFAAVNTR